MKEFKFEADFIFMAENIDDAFEKIGKHFLALLSENEKETLDFTGNINIVPVK